MKDIVYRCYDHSVQSRDTAVNIQLDLPISPEWPFRLYNYFSFRQLWTLHGRWSEVLVTSRSMWKHAWWIRDNNNSECDWGHPTRTIFYTEHQQQFEWVSNTISTERWYMYNYICLKGISKEHLQKVISQIWTNFLGSYWLPTKFWEPWQDYWQLL